ncbi:hypothetical protein SAMN05660860_01683 [Geoalkalibacter ferrihydriticus]|uniref:Uncharacterized protein n=2 Tax=Geoalkalibacter ferrihydriticus TaxID=392333 RepID=A0A0C2HHT0_9BACT|nr:hypothetical protein [Geoalkalibacter ferrihydriticus]KIH76556.1 hypothetical protein GFER_10330 [Geoalkalibacter ferrihydriticus DSM 17813]SDM01312.1 hypothetical protein SAMN05660860_01683 [Geoalkalibacter ferrihydriticus]
MDIFTAFIALAWGIIAGYLIIRFIDSLIALAVCVHGLYISRWQRLADKTHTGRIKPGIILRLMARISLFTLAFGFLLHLGYNLTQRQFGFNYDDAGAILWVVVACATALSRLPATRRRVVFVWRMSHEYDYAEKRRRTQMLRG